MEPRRIELLTFCLQSRRSPKLSYGPLLNFFQVIAKEQQQLQCHIPELLFRQKYKLNQIQKEVAKYLLLDKSKLQN